MGSIKISGIRALGTHEHFSGTLSSWVEGHGSWVWDSFMGLRVIKDNLRWDPLCIILGILLVGS